MKWSYLATASFLLATIVVLPTPASADTCDDVLDEAAWLCDPQPDPELDISDCLEACSTEPFYLVTPGFGVQSPGIWIVSCNVMGHGVPMVAVGEEVCPHDGSEPVGSFELVPATDIVDPEGMALVHVTTGFCEYTAHVMVYGTWGGGIDHQSMNCAFVDPA